MSAPVDTAVTIVFSNAVRAERSEDRHRVTPIGVLRQHTTEAMIRNFIIILSQWGSARGEVDQPGWAILAEIVVENPAPEIPKRLKVAEPRVVVKTNVAVNLGKV